MFGDVKGNCRVTSWAIRAFMAILAQAALTSAFSAERSRDFLEALREQGLFALSVDYLEQVRTSPTASKAFQGTIDLEKGISLLSAVQLGEAGADRERRLAEAKDSLQAFLAANPKHPLAPTARAQLAAAAIEQARWQAEAAIRAGKKGPEREAVMAAVRKTYSEAGEALAATEKELEATLAKVPKVTGVADARSDGRAVVSRQILNVQLISAALAADAARTQEPGEAAKKAWAAAADRFGQVAKKYPKYLAGSLARIEEARCFKEQGDFASASAVVVDVLNSKERSEPFGIVRNKARVLAAELAMAVKPGQDATEPDHGEEEAARIMLIRGAIEAGDLDRAIEYLARVPVDSAGRGEIDLTAGQAMWSAYLKASRLPEGARPKQAELDRMIAQAKKTLDGGIARLRKAAEAKDPSTTLVLSILALAHIAVGTGDGEAAVAALEDSFCGPMTVLGKADSGHPLAQSTDAVAETYKTAIRAYVATGQLEKAEKALESLEKTIEARGEQAGARLAQIDISLGRELEDQLHRFRQEGKTEQSAKVEKAFEAFVKRIADRNEGANFHSLHWIAETFAGMGAGHDPGSGTLPADAESYYARAAEACAALIQRWEAEPKFAPSEDVALGVYLRESRILRRLGQYRESMDALCEVMKKRPKLASLQIEAAKTYQAWGETNPAYFTLAIVGGHKMKQADGSERNLVWGWGELARQLQRVPSMAEDFFEARLNLAICRLKSAEAAADADERTKKLEQAESDIQIVYRLYPEMGGAEWIAKFDTLLKTIQKLRGQANPGGLKASAALASVKEKSK